MFAHRTDPKALNKDMGPWNTVGLYFFELDPVVWTSLQENFGGKVLERQPHLP
jgi:hypothetical protein